MGESDRLERVRSYENDLNQLPVAVLSFLGRVSGNRCVGIYAELLSLDQMALLMVEDEQKVLDPLTHSDHLLLCLTKVPPAGGVRSFAPRVLHRRFRHLPRVP